MKTPRTVGVEEELLLVDPETRTISPRSSQVVRANREHGEGEHPRAASDELDLDGSAWTTLPFHSGLARSDHSFGRSSGFTRSRLAMITISEAAKGVL